MDESNAANLIFLGTGAAWRTPEAGCGCLICKYQRTLGEKRTRTSLWFEGSSNILIDCGPDVIDQLEQNGLDRPDAILITHEHGDHYIGLDELEVFRRRVPANDFRPIPVYATEDSWQAIEVRFGYLLGRLLEKRIAVPGEPLRDLPGKDLTVTPFKTDHGPIPKGSVGYVFEYKTGKSSGKMIYTSDFKDIVQDLDLLAEPDVLVGSCHWFNEPETNPPSHMSLQRLVEFVRKWRVRERVYLVHMSAGDLHQEEKAGEFMKKRPPLAPMRDPNSGKVLHVPRCHDEWQSGAEKVFEIENITVPVTVSRDGMKEKI